MSSKFESSIREIPYAQQKVYDALSDLSNLERIRDRIPQDKLEDFSFDADHIAVKTPMVGEIRLHIIEREEPKTSSLRPSRALCPSPSGYSCCP